MLQEENSVFVAKLNKLDDEQWWGQSMDGTEISSKLGYRDVSRLIFNTEEKLKDKLVCFGPVDGRLGFRV